MAFQAFVKEFDLVEDTSKSQEDEPVDAAADDEVTLAATSAGGDVATKGFGGDKSSARQKIRNKYGAKSWGCDNLRKGGKNNDVPGGGLTLFEGAEHERTADGLLLYDIYGKREKNAFDHGVWVINRGTKFYELKFGRIIALAGDHYSTHDTELWFPQRGPVCGFQYYKDLSFDGCIKRFRSAVESLAYDLDGYFPDIAALMDRECGAVAKVEQEKGSVKQIYHRHDCGIPTDKEWFDALKKIGPGGAGRLLSLYAWFSYVNFDHFGADAEKAYSAGHALAIHYARVAGKADNEEKKSRGLNEAYLYEAFASHYLTDLFSSGHNRAPRRKFHSTDVNMTAVAGAKSNLLKETPIWDMHCRYMHDDDSASGLLVKNEKGDYWIQYGDKQLLEPGNVLNRVRVTQCLQASVDELWNLGFNYKGGIDDPLPPSNKFAAFRLLPKPMLSFTDPNGWVKNWNGYDQHNIAPLWRAESPDEPETKKWSYRKDLNDHSKFTRLPGSPKGEWSASLVKATEESMKIAAAEFKGEGQFLEGKAFPFIDTGGFLQVQELMVDGKARRCLNVWAPANVKFRRTDNMCFTIRNRILDFDGGAPTYDPKSLHWDSWYDGSSTSMYHFHQADGGKGDMILTVYPLKDPKASDETQIVDFDPEKSWNFTIDSNTITESKVPVSPLSGLRFILGNFEKGNTSKSPDLAMLSFATSGSAQLNVGTIRDGKYKQLGASNNVSLKANALHFLKKINGSSDQADSVALVSASQSGSQVSLDITIFSVDTKVQAKTLAAVPLSYSGPLEDVSVMIGNVLGGNKPAIIATASSSSKSNTVLVIDPSNGAVVSHSCNPKPASALGTFVTHHLTALLPSAKSESSTDLVTVDSYKSSNGKDYVLSFTTHLGNTDSKTPFSTCTSTEVRDPLAPYAKSGAYFTIKWQRCTGETDPRGIMEIFSLYGVLGARYFSAYEDQSQENTTAWKLAGQIPYLGQTSLGAGRGSHLNWGHGFMSWGLGCNKEFIDSNMVIAEGRKGAFGFRLEDASKPIVGGWDENVRKTQAF